MYFKNENFINNDESKKEQVCLDILISDTKENIIVMSFHLKIGIVWFSVIQNNLLQYAFIL